MVEEAGRRVVRVVRFVEICLAGRMNSLWCSVPPICDTFKQTPFGLVVLFPGV